ncbi:MAG: hypothetical protein ACOX6G_10895 [Christensenellales bacterium]|jgi:hypothetical protein
MQEFRNAANHRVCDISEDRKSIVIINKGCKTVITANIDQTLKVQNIPEISNTNGN